MALGMSVRGLGRLANGWQTHDVDCQGFGGGPRQKEAQARSASLPGISKDAADHGVYALFMTRTHGLLSRYHIFALEDLPGGDLSFEEEPLARCQHCCCLVLGERWSVARSALFMAHITRSTSLRHLIPPCKLSWN